MSAASAAISHILDNTSTEHFEHAYHIGICICGRNWPCSILAKQVDAQISSHVQADDNSDQEHYEDEDRPDSGFCICGNQWPCIAWWEAIEAYIRKQELDDDSD